ncbi:bZIP transcription factor 29 [Raphanus sativus]|uniref:BZIP transcription factor 29 n=1 Tax=Raphanus sativus TaxID=3726 RepID=A0A6J0N213_RAPSA|nr:bZIP transcription factor 29 [Raphanus sativus]XP_018478024.2 bZIP transcription factor 29 [Raphanus sativus]XP_018478025.2 bZIP transcription factor 29 [Raphanus sativus]
MGDTETDMIHRHHSSFGTSPCSIPKQKQKQKLEINPNVISRSSESGKRVGVPPTSPYSQIHTSHSRSMSQPSSFFSLDSSLPPLSPSPFLRDHMDDRDSRPFSNNNNHPSSLFPPSPRNSHRRSNSDIPTAFPPRPVSGGESSANPFVKKEDREAMDDLFSAYMNLDALNSSDNLSRDDMESSRASKTNGGSDTEGESSSVNYESGGDHNNLKRRAADIAPPPTTRHYRSVSVDSCFMDKLSFAQDSLKPPPSPMSRKVSPTNSVDGAAAAFSMGEFNKKGEFSAAEIKKIMANDKLAEMALSDPKRVKRILANRQSAARSKERKMRYIVELEHKVQTLQTEATTLSAQLTLLQRDMMGLTNQNNELKFRLQAMEQQARLRDALNEALNGEVQRLKLAIGESESDRSKMQSLNADMFQQLNISQSRQQQQPHQNGGTLSTKPESNE